MLRSLVDRLGWGIAGATTVTLVAVLAGVVSAGPLDPGGPPSAPSGVFGSGTPISALPYTISSPGSYYVTGNLTGTSGQNGITIAANDVTLDLRGFTLQGVPGSGSGVKLQTPTFWRAITVRNGTARGWGDTGVHAQFVNGGVFDALNAEENALWGIIVGDGAVLSHCSATNNGTGISASKATIVGCAANNNVYHGFQISATVLTDCIATYNGNQGVDASIYSRIEGCTVLWNHGMGIHAAYTDVVGNRVSNSDGTGIEVFGDGATIARNTVDFNSQFGTGYGISVTGANNRIDENHVTDATGFATQDVGISVTGGANIVIRNTAHGNSANYGLTGAGGTYGPLTTAASASNPFANIDY